MSALLLPLAEQLRPAVRGQAVWEEVFESLVENKQCSYALHLAIFIEPYLSLILDGRKTIESRFARRRQAPYGCIAIDDVILLKRSGGPIVGICQASEVNFYERGSTSWESIRDRYADPLCATDPNFWTARETTLFASLIHIKRVCPVTPGVAYVKRDRRAWVVLQPAERQMQG